MDARPNCTPAAPQRSVKEYEPEPIDLTPRKTVISFGPYRGLTPAQATELRGKPLRHGKKAAKAKPPKNPMRWYISRNARLAAIGFASYADYLASDMWAEIKARVLTRDACRCIGCGKPGFSVHHSNYRPETLKGESIRGLLTVCRPCHEAAEIDPGGRKRTLEEANQTLFRARAEREDRKPA